MSLNRRAAKRDSPEAAIIAAAEALGAVVLQVSGVGLPDTLVCHKGRTYLVEVKRIGRTLTHAQGLTFVRIAKSGVPIYIAETPDDMHAILTGGMRPWVPASRPVEGEKKRPHRPGKDRMRSTKEMCSEDFCPKSRLPGDTKCQEHADVVPAPKRKP